MSGGVVRSPSRARRRPDARLWTEISWAWGGMERNPSSRTLQGSAAVLAVAGLLAAAALSRLRLPEPAAPEPETHWLEVPPPQTVEAVAPAVVRPPESPPEPTPEPRESAPSEIPSDAATSEVLPEPVFGIPDAGEAGGMAVASGNDLMRASEPTVREVPPTLAAGPVRLDSPPGVLEAVAPLYPPRAEAEGREATVLVRVTTDTLGAVVDLRIERSGGRDFDASVRRAVLSTRFQVPVREGRAQAVSFRMPYRFRLD